jgi:hypothetical protein
MQEVEAAGGGRRSCSAPSIAFSIKLQFAVRQRCVAYFRHIYATLVNGAKNNGAGRLLHNSRLSSVHSITPSDLISVSRIGAKRPQLRGKSIYFAHILLGNFG